MVGTLTLPDALITEHDCEGAVVSDTKQMIIIGDSRAIEPIS
jgi:hypothetical protein